MRLSLPSAPYVPWLVLLATPFLIHSPLWLLGLSSDPIYITGGLAERAPHGGLPGLPGWLDPNAGFTTAALGGFAAQQWLQGIVPWWNPYTWVGMSLAAEAQPAPLFLPFTLLLALRDGVLWNKIALQVVGGFAMLGLLREWRMPRRLAVLGAVLFELNGSFAWWAHAPINPLPFLPLILLGIERAAHFARARHPGGWAWVAVGIAASLYGGFPEVAYLNSLLAVSLAVWRIVAAESGRAGLALARKLAVAAVIGLLLSAPATVPFLMALPGSDIGGHAVMGDRLTDPSVWALLLVPYIQGPLGQTSPGYTAVGYLGLPVVWLALLALTRRDGRRGLRWVLATWMLLAIAKSLQVPGIAPAFDMIPFVQKAAFSLYAIPSYQTACLLLACLGIEDWVQRGPPVLAARVGAGVVLLALLVATAWVARPWVVPVLHISRLHAAYVVVSAYMGTVALLAVMALVWRAPGGARARMLGAVLTGYAAFVFALPLLSGTRKLPMDWSLVSFLRGHLGWQRIYTLGPLAPNWGARFGIASINYNMLPVPLTWTGYIHQHLDPGADSILFIGSIPPDEPGQETRAEALARRADAFAAIGVRYVLAPVNSDPFHGAPAEPRIFRSAIADVFELPNPAPYVEARGAACVLTQTVRETVSAVCDAPATLVRREFFDAGWRARVNGTPATVTPIDEIFQAVSLPAGKSEVRFTFAPLYTGWAVTGAAAALGLLGAGVWRGRRG
jgi:hypothetical protein